MPLAGSPLLTAGAWTGGRPFPVSSQSPQGGVRRAELRDCPMVSSALEFSHSGTLPHPPRGLSDKLITEKIIEGFQWSFCRLC